MSPAKKSIKSTDRPTPNVSSIATNDWKEEDEDANSQIKMHCEPKSIRIRTKEKLINKSIRNYNTQREEENKVKYIK